MLVREAGTALHRTFIARDDEFRALNWNLVAGGLNSEALALVVDSLEQRVGQETWT
jgi:hypothetical protein